MLGLVLTLLTSSGWAAPRVGVHPGYTRLVFDLAVPQPVKVKTTVKAPYVSLSLTTLLRPEQGKLSAPGVTAYSVSGSTIRLTLAPNYAKSKVEVIPRQGSQPQRLVVDIAKVPSTSKPVIKASAAPAPKPAPRPRVVIDPGHGGIDPGMVSRYLREKDVTLAVALKVRSLLVARGVDVVMTRSTDRHLSTDKRTDLDARSDMARAGTVSAYVSIHVNAGNPGAQGIETYYFGQPIDAAKQALAIQENGAGSIGQELTRKAASAAQNTLGDILAQAKLNFSRDLASKVQASLLQQTGAVNRGVHMNTFYVIRNPNTAAILTEIGFGDSAREGPLLATSAYQDKVARGIAQAILAFLHMK
ncbi:N-acetylmuramoyl-L-alanine amidase family protein [Deinococcus sp. VB343]|uniref:N-acetylmuramoyl-L-alanine amidase family protein n=1 Tax=Deinococcus sp. VB343 TaxID=3385567 RepID=UPI0039C99162